MQPLMRDGYTEQQVKDALHAKFRPRDIKFRYDLLDKDEVYKKTLDIVVSGEVSVSAFSQIKRTARFKMKDDPDIDWLSDRVQPFVIIKIETIIVGKKTTWQEIAGKKWSDL